MTESQQWQRISVVRASSLKQFNNIRDLLFIVAGNKYKMNVNIHTRIYAILCISVGVVYTLGRQISNYSKIKCNEV